MQALQPGSDTVPAQAAEESRKPSKFAFDRIRSYCQLHRQCKEFLVLPFEEAIVSESFDRGHSPSISRQGRPNYGALRQTRAQKVAWLRQNLVGLRELR